MVGIALYASMTATMSSRRIERALATDVGFRVVAANERPDHVTICRFIVRHHDLLEDLFAQVVGLAAEAGLIDVTLIAVDGTKLPGDASPSRNRTLGDLRGQFAGWADDVEANDAAEDAAEAADPDGGPIEEMFEPDDDAAVDPAAAAGTSRRTRRQVDERDRSRLGDAAPLRWWLGAGLQRPGRGGGRRDRRRRRCQREPVGLDDVGADGHPHRRRGAGRHRRTGWGGRRRCRLLDHDGIAVIEADEDLPDVFMATGR